MTTTTTAPTRYGMDAAVDLGAVELTVGDLGRSLGCCTGSIGLQVLAQDAGSARIGVPGRTLAVLPEIPGAPPAPPSSPGLSHFAPRCRAGRTWHGSWSTSPARGWRVT